MCVCVCLFLEGGEWKERDLNAPGDCAFFTIRDCTAALTSRKIISPAALSFLCIYTYRTCMNPPVFALISFLSFVVVVVVVVMSSHLERKEHSIIWPHVGSNIFKQTSERSRM